MHFLKFYFKNFAESKILDFAKQYKGNCFGDPDGPQFMN